MTIEMMKDRLQKAYPDAQVDVIDLTGTSDHWEVYVETGAFHGLSRIQQHQAVMSVFGPELKTGEVHALSIKTKIKS
jgi:stress-induced morphogen